MKKSAVMKSMKSLLKNKLVLYAVLAISGLHAFNLFSQGSYNNLTLFIVVLLLSTYFSKNMIIVLIIGLVVSYVANGRYVEGMKEGREGVDEDEEDEEDEETETVRYYKKNGKCLKVKKNKIKKFCANNKCFKNSKCKVTETLSSQPMELNNLNDKQDSQVDYADTVKLAYKNLEDMLGEGGLKSLTAETKQLMAQQKGLASSLKSMGPLLQQAQETMKGLNMPDMGSMGNMAKLIGGNKKK